MFQFEKIPLHWVNRVAVLARKELVHRFRTAGYDVSAEEWAILMLLWRDDGQNPGEMSERTVRDPTTMTRLIDGMVKKGFVHRQADANDRRKSRICLSETGRALEADLIAHAQPLLARAMDGISAAEAEAAIGVLKRMNDNLSKKA